MRLADGAVRAGSVREVPATVPSVFSLMYLQAHHLDIGFYDEHFGPGAYLQTHARHLERCHPER